MGPRGRARSTPRHVDLRCERRAWGVTGAVGRAPSASATAALSSRALERSARVATEATSSSREDETTAALRARERSARVTMEATLCAVGDDCCAQRSRQPEALASRWTQRSLRRRTRRSKSATRGTAKPSKRRGDVPSPRRIGLAWGDRRELRNRVGPRVRRARGARALEALELRLHFELTALENRGRPRYESRRVGSER